MMNLTSIYKFSFIHEYFNEIKLNTKNNLRGLKQFEKIVDAKRKDIKKKKYLKRMNTIFGS
jgi:hypothetical protein